MVAGKQLRREGWIVGKTKVFLRETQDRARVEEMRLARLARLVVKLQSIFRGFRVRKKQNAAKYEALQDKIHAERLEATKGASAIKLQAMLRGIAVRRNREPDPQGDDGVETKSLAPAVITFLLDLGTRPWDVRRCLPRPPGSLGVVGVRC